VEPPPPNPAEKFKRAYDASGALETLKNDQVRNALENAWSATEAVNNGYWVLSGTLDVTGAEPKYSPDPTDVLVVKTPDGERRYAFANFECGNCSSVDAVLNGDRNLRLQAWAPDQFEHALTDFKQRGRSSFAIAGWETRGIEPVSFDYAVEREIVSWSDTTGYGWVSEGTRRGRVDEGEDTFFLDETESGEGYTYQGSLYQAYKFWPRYAWTRNGVRHEIGSDAEISRYHRAASTTGLFASGSILRDGSPVGELHTSETPAGPHVDTAVRVTVGDQSAEWFTALVTP
jgi:hypothetical protein